MYYLYILYSPTVRKFYIGITSDIEQRIRYHNSGRSPYTRSKGPWHLVYAEAHETRNRALQREREVKDWKSSRRITREFGIDIVSIGSSVPAVTG